MSPIYPSQFLDFLAGKIVFGKQNPDFADKFGPTLFVSFDVPRVFPGTSGVVQLLAEESFGRFAVKRFKEKGGKEAPASEKTG